MARRAKRNVNRSGTGGRQAIVHGYNTRAWYELPDWAVVWLSQNAGWITLILSAILAPAALLALVLGAHSLPLEFLGVPASANGVGLAALSFLAEFIFLALAVRPFFRLQRGGWRWVIAAALVHLIHSLVLQHAASGIIILVLVIYLYTQLKNRFS